MYQSTAADGDILFSPNSHPTHIHYFHPIEITTPEDFAPTPSIAFVSWLNHLFVISASLQHRRYLMRPNSGELPARL